MKHTYCQVCNKRAPQKRGRGRPLVYCSAACRQRAYRDRTRVREIATKDRAVEELDWTIHSNFPFVGT